MLSESDRLRTNGEGGLNVGDMTAVATPGVWATGLLRLRKMRK